MISRLFISMKAKRNRFDLTNIEILRLSNVCAKQANVFTASMMSNDNIKGSSNPCPEPQSWWWSR
jgi:hypothetical protein